LLHEVAQAEQGQTDPAWYSSLGFSPPTARQAGFLTKGQKHIEHHRVLHVLSGRQQRQGTTQRYDAKGVTLEDYPTFLPDRVLSRTMMYEMLKEVDVRIELFDVLPLGMVDAFNREATKKNAIKMVALLQRISADLANCL
jgi:hypothetical protein